MAQTQADRSAAAQKAAVTRKRNAQKTESEIAGKKAAGTAQQRDAKQSLSEARNAVGGAISSLTPDVGGAVSGLRTAAGHVSDAVVAATKAARTRSEAAEQEETR
jgi:hypothetical protein